MAEEGILRNRVWLAGAAGVVLAACLSGCTYSLSEFARPDPGTVASTSAAEPEGEAMPLEPVALMPADPLPATPTNGAAQAVATAPATTGNYVPPGPPPGQSDSKLLTPEEKAKVIAELEALARGQKVVPPGQPRTACEDETLDPAERIRREAEGIEC